MDLKFINGTVGWTPESISLLNELSSPGIVYLPRANISKAWQPSKHLLKQLTLPILSHSGFNVAAIYCAPFCKHFYLLSFMFYISLYFCCLVVPMSVRAAIGLDIVLPIMPFLFRLKSLCIVMFWCNK